MSYDEREEVPTGDEPAIEEFKGKPVLNLTPGARFPISLGVKKAKAILDNLDVVRKFVESNGTSID